MFTLEESALLARMIRFVGWTLVALVAAVVVWVVWR